MKSITQISQLDDNVLKKIINGKEDVMSQIIDSSFRSCCLAATVQEFANDFAGKFRIAFQAMIERTIGEEFFEMLETAMEEGKDTSRNGYYERKVRTSMGDFTIQIPRARFLNFTTKLLNKYGHNIGDISERVLSLYRGGMTENDIVKSLAEIDGIGLSAATVQKIISETVGEAAKFNSEPIDDCPFVYLDATYVPFKRAEGMGKSVEKEGILVAVGITPSGYRKVLGYAFGETEKKERWIALLTDLKKRGLKNPKMFITDGLSGMPDAVDEVFHGTLHQRCLVHYMRNLKGYVRKSDAKRICEEFHHVYDSQTKEEATERFGEFSAFWGTKYPGLRKMLDKADDNIFSYYSFPKEIRSGIYTSNAIEGFNSKLKRETRRRVVMNSEGNATVVITAICRSYNSSKLGRRMNGLLGLTPEKRRELGFSFLYEAVSSCQY